MKDLIDVGLYLRGDDLDPAFVSEKLGISPSDSQYKGERKVTSTNREYVAKIGVWTVDADSDSCNLSDHINRLISQVGKDGNALRNMEGVQEAFVDVFIATVTDKNSRDGTCEFELDRESLSALKQLDLPVRFTVAFGPE